MKREIGLSTLLTMTEEGVTVSRYLTSLLTKILPFGNEKSNKNILQVQQL